MLFQHVTRILAGAGLRSKTLTFHTNVESVNVGMEGQMDRQADGWMDSQSVEWTDRRMNKASDRVANLKLKDSIAQ